MNIYYNTQFKGFYPVGVSAIVVCNNVDEAATILNNALVDHGLEATAKYNQFTRIPFNHGVVRILQDGEY